MASKPMVSMDAAGYREVVRTQDLQQMVAFLRRVLQEHQLPEVPEANLQQLARQHLKVPSSFQELLHELRSQGSQAPAVSSGAPMVDPAQALYGGTTTNPMLSPEVMIDGRLAAQAVDASGILAMVSPPWSLRNIFAARSFQLVIRNVADPARGLVVASSADEQSLRATAQLIINELGSQVALLGQAEAYQALQCDAALLARLGRAPSAAAAELQIATAPPEEECRPDEEHGDCPICLEPMGPGEAAMRCAGDGGQHHYFHARCLSTWVRRRDPGTPATCPMCRGQLQMNGQRLQEFLDGEQSAQLSEDDRTYLQSLADGLRGRNSWGNMNRLEKAAYAGGLLAAAGWGFMLGYTERRHHVSHALVLDTLPAEHQLAQGVGWLVGLIVSCIRQSLRDREREESERRNRRC